MKTRNGFVSNSSTTSFCIMGIELDELNFPEEPNEEERKLMEECEYEDVSDIDRSERMDIRFDKSGLDYEIEPYNDNVYVGLSVSKMRPDETMAQFQERAAELIRQHLPECDKKPGWIVDAWRDG